MRYTRKALCAVLSFVFVMSVGAQTPQRNSRKITVAVPFDFMVGHTMFPAGNYMITQIGDQSFSVRARHGIESANFSGLFISTPSAAHTPSLNFEKANGHLQLRQLWVNSSLGVELPGNPLGQVFALNASHVRVPADCMNCN